jgi:hypothetical protein
VRWPRCGLAIRARRPKPRGPDAPCRAFREHGGRCRTERRAPRQRKASRNGDKWSSIAGGPVEQASNTARGTPGNWRFRGDYNAYALPTSSVHRATGRSAPRRSAHPRTLVRADAGSSDRRTRRLPNNTGGEALPASHLQTRPPQVKHTLMSSRPSEARAGTRLSARYVPWKVGSRIALRASGMTAGSAVLS